MIKTEDVVNRKLNKRDIMEQIIPWLSERESIIIVGSRQVGKSCLMFLLAQYLLKTKIANLENIAFFDLESSADLEICNSGVSALLEHLRLAGKKFHSKRILYLFIDEIQYLDNPSQLVKLLVDHHPEIKIIASGSSSTGLRKKFKDTLPGRKQEFHLQSLAFKEFLNFRQEHQLSELTEKFCLRNIFGKRMPEPPAIQPFLQRLIPLFEEYTVYGGHPAVVMADSADIKQKRLQSIINDYLRKDIHTLFDIDHLGSFTQLIKILAGQIGSLTVYSELTTPLGITYRTLQRYLDILSVTFVVDLIPPYFSNVKKRVIKSPKTYFYDTGIRNALINQFLPLSDRIDKGHLVENVIFQLLAGLQDIANPVSFWRTYSGTEIDFLIRDMAIEVKYQPLKSAKVPRAMKSGMSQINAKNTLVVTKDFLDSRQLNDTQALFIPACLLSR
ncbi:MAG: ATP-binding protein [bacterium]|nr:ATP-binding protein [bacterium]